MSPAALVNKAADLEARLQVHCPAVSITSCPSPCPASCPTHCPTIVISGQPGRDKNDATELYVQGSWEDIVMTNELLENWVNESIVNMYIGSSNDIISDDPQQGVNGDSTVKLEPSSSHEYLHSVLSEPHFKNFEARQDFEDGLVDVKPRFGATSTLGVSGVVDSSNPEDDAILLKEPKSTGKMAARKITRRLKRSRSPDESASAPALKFECEECGYVFTRVRHLAKHKISAHGASALDCAVCSATFAMPQDLNRHLLTHTQRYRCTLCGELLFVSLRWLRVTVGSLRWVYLGSHYSFLDQTLLQY